MKRFIASAAALLMLLTGLIAFEPKAEAAGSAPVAANLELTTYRGVSVGGQLAAYDPDGGELTFDSLVPGTQYTIEAVALEGKKMSGSYSATASTLAETKILSFTATPISITQAELNFILQDGRTSTPGPSPTRPPGRSRRA